MIGIAIDGPSGAGKSTIAKALAESLGYIYVDTGAIYRTVGLHMYNAGVSTEDTEGIVRNLPDVRFELKYENGTQVVYLNGENLGDRIRTPEMSMYASAVSAIPAVRTFLLETQRKIARENSVIMDGRDIGTVILPNANVKIFLTASDECRAMRRRDELVAKGIEVSYEEVLSDMRERDRNDSTRSVAPAVAAEDAVLFDNSWMSPDQCTAAIIKLIQEKTQI